MKCKKCGCENDEYNIYCDKCGERIFDEKQYNEYLKKQETEK